MQVHIRVLKLGRRWRMPDLGKPFHSSFCRRALPDCGILTFGKHQVEGHSKVKQPVRADLRNASPPESSRDSWP